MLIVVTDQSPDAAMQGQSYEFQERRPHNISPLGMNRIVHHSIDDEIGHSVRHLDYLEIIIHGIQFMTSNATFLPGAETLISTSTAPSIVTVAIHKEPQARVEHILTTLSSLLIL
jgi:hypothetical protein